MTHHITKNDSRWVTHHYKGDRNSIGVANDCAVLKPGHNRDSEDHEDPVDPGDVDLTDHDRGSVDDVEAREAAERDRLLDDGEGPGDHGLPHACTLVSSTLSPCLDVSKWPPVRLSNGASSSVLPTLEVHMAPCMQGACRVYKLCFMRKALL